MSEREIIDIVMDQLQSAIDDDIIKRSDVMEYVGVSRSQLARWLDRSYMPGADNFLRLCLLLNIDMNKLLYDFTNQEVEILKLIRRLAQDDLDTLRKFALFLDQSN